MIDPIPNLLMTNIDLNFLILKALVSKDEQSRSEIIEDAITLVEQTRSYFETCTTSDVLETVDSVNNIKPLQTKDILKKRLWRGKKNDL